MSGLDGLGWSTPVAIVTDDSPPRDVTVVRLSTSWWSDNRGAHKRKSITYLKRKSRGFNCFAEDISCAGVEPAMESIINLDDAPDGVYELVFRALGRDWETGHVEEWEFELVPYTA